MNKKDQFLVSFLTIISSRFVLRTKQCVFSLKERAVDFGAKSIQL